MPSNFVILDKKIEGYNNVLTTATEEMSFGVNKDVNYSKPKPKPKPKPMRKPDGLIDNHFHNNANNGGCNSSNDDNDDNDDDDNSTILFRKGKSKYSASSAELPIVFFLSIAVGVFASKKIFS